MKITYSAQNINCGSCANTIKNALEDDFGKIEVNLNVKPSQVTVNLDDAQKENSFKNEMSDIGFEVIEEISRA